MSMSLEPPCYILVNVPNDMEFPTENQLKDKMEKGILFIYLTLFLGDIKDKIDALKKLIYMIQSGEKVNQTMIMFVIRFCLPSTDHYLKKLLLIFWEVVPKVGFIEHLTLI